MQTIRALRLARGWSQYDLARRVGVHPQAVYLWEHNRRTPQVMHMRALGAVFEMCSDEIDLAPGGGADDSGGNDQSATYKLPGPRVDVPESSPTDSEAGRTIKGILPRQEGGW